MQRALGLDDSPALAVPLRFLLAAPCFGCAAGLLLAWAGPDALQSRWTPAALALTHLVTLGFLAMAMIGAMLQMLPVVAGLAIPALRIVSTASWSGLASGTLLLAAGMFGGQAALVAAGALLVGSGLLCFAAATGRALARRALNGAFEMVAGMRAALAGLLAAAVLGLSLAAAWTGIAALPVLQLTGLHAAWGLLGWVAMLVIAVSFQVIPMFQGTATYPRRLALGLPAGLLLVLAAWSAGYLRGASWQAWPAAAIALALAAFAGFTLYLLARRKRAPDVTTLYWYLSLSSAIACALLWFVMDGDSPQRPLLLGILFIGGFAASAVNGMLYKIMPFLLWYHLAAAGLPRRMVPGVNHWIGTRAARAQFGCHASAVVALAASVPLHALARPAGLLFACGMAWLGAMLAKAALRYRRLLRESARESA
ncbi:permease [Massilia terrae]|uniref:Permease n=1 Tax=Massilia terrae TaxID=1811224 RepID=A0ABT2D452_9BURK|nr:permease [Massilia terrae]MCS0660805.1 permease [Massilia terrae]